MKSQKTIEFRDPGTGCWVVYHPRQPLIEITFKNCYFWNAKEMNDLIDFLRRIQKKIRKMEGT